MKSSRIYKNLIILIIAPFLAWWLLFLMNDFSWLTASVLDIWEIQKVKDEWRDLAYKTENQTLEIFWSEKVKTAEKLEIEILYNPEKIQLFTENASWVNYEILNEEEGVLDISLTEISERDYKEWWFEVPYSWDEYQVLLWDSWKTERDERASLSIGNLNAIEEHSILP